MANESTALAGQESTEATNQTADQQTANTDKVRDPEAVLKQNQELLAELKKARELAKKAEGFDFEKARAAIESQEKAEQERLTKKGEWDKLKEQLDARHAAELQKSKEAYDSLLSNLKRERLTNVLTEKGVLPDRAKYLVHELGPQIELVSDDAGFQLRKVGGIGDSAEFDALIENVKAASPFFFAATTASGSGASGSQNSGSGQTAKTWTRSQWDAASSEDRMAFSAAKGQVTD